MALSSVLKRQSPENANAASFPPKPVSLNPNGCGIGRTRDQIPVPKALKSQGPRRPQTPESPSKAHLPPPFFQFGTDGGSGHLHFGRFSVPVLARVTRLCLTSSASPAPGSPFKTDVKLSKRLRTQCSGRACGDVRRRQTSQSGKKAYRN